MQWKNRNSINHLSEEQIIQKINSDTLLSISHRWMKNIDDFKPESKCKAKHAAVLVPLFREKDTWKLLFTRRTQNLVDHSGQVAFPGGQLDEIDLTPENAAKREAYEEIGLQPDDTRILGRLNEIHTITNYLVNPIVGVIPWPFQFELSRVEVSRIFSIPLTWLANPKNYYITTRIIPAENITIRTIIYNPYDNETLWGVSAMIVQDFLTILLS
jgi:8-oxo-dGTP pyrophosphatase MutT (NUDIX family)